MLLVYVYWHSLIREDGRNNFGDLLTKYIVEKIYKSKFHKVEHPSMRRYKYFIKHYLVIGSVLELANKNSIVWGSGIIRKNQFVRKAKFIAVRGPKTRNRLMELGYKIPEIYGDPAILLPIYFKNNVKKRFKIGIVPHYVNFEEVNTFFKNSKDLKIINLITDNIEKTINELLECEMIISSSLHGIIVSQSYSIPSLWVKFSNKLGGDNIKFFDYFESVGINYKKDIQIDISKHTLKSLLGLFESNKDILLPNEKILNFRQEELIKCCPFNKNIFKRMWYAYR